MISVPLWQHRVCPEHGAIWRRWIAVMLMLMLAPTTFAQSSNEQLVRDLLGTALACRLVGDLLADMPVAPLYESDGANCSARLPDDLSEGGTTFRDPECTLETRFVETSLLDYCDQATDEIVFGEGQALTSGILNGSGRDAFAWTLSPGSRLDLGARSLEAIAQPYLQRRVYRRVATDRGNCTLEMRVYAAHPGVSEQRSLLALHGGSWSARSFGFLGLELTVPHLVDKGFVVYAPFYRLLDDGAGSEACNSATIDDVVDDAEAALSWLEAEASNYGSAGKPVVFGQSAGAHLALSLAVNQAERISGAIAFYPPTDFRDFVERVQSGAYTNEAGIGILEDVLGVSAADADVSAPVVVANSFPDLVQASMSSLPPIFLMHGLADELVEARQSVRLCNALAGRVVRDENALDARQVLTREIDICGGNVGGGSESRLHLIREGQHALDVCFNSSVPLESACLSGSEDSRRFVADSIGQAAEFAQSVFDESEAVQGEEPTGTTTDSDTSDTGARRGGGGACGAMLSLMLLLCVWSRCMARRLR